MKFWKALVSRIRRRLSEACPRCGVFGACPECSRRYEAVDQELKGRGL